MSNPAACGFDNIGSTCKKMYRFKISAKAGIQMGTGCRTKSGTTELLYSVACLIRTAYDMLLTPYLHSLPAAHCPVEGFLTLFLYDSLGET